MRNYRGVFEMNPLGVYYHLNMSITGRAQRVQAQVLGKYYLLYKAFS